MARGTEIIINAQAQGRLFEGPIVGTPKPGTVMEIDASAGVSNNGNFTWEVYNRDADGNRPAGPLVVLLPDRFQGKLETQAYATGDWCEVYCPLNGDELNMLIADVAGTGDDHALGELLIVDDGTGKLIATTGTPENEPFMLMEAITDPEADTLAHTLFSGF